jgi:hypothetical protein
MGSDTIKLGYQYTYVLHPFGNLVLNPKHSLYAHGIRMLTIHSGNVIEPIYKRYYLIIRKVFRMLFKATVEVSDVRYNFFNKFAIH